MKLAREAVWEFNTIVKRNSEENSDEATAKKQG